MEGYAPLSKRTGVTPEMSVREALRTFPETRAVFDKYGMMGCGGAEGPVEAVEFFAQMHSLSTVDLLSELNAVILPKVAGVYSNGQDPCPCGGGSRLPEQAISPAAARLLSAPLPSAEGSKCTHGESSKSLARVFVRTSLSIFLLFGASVGLISLMAVTHAFFSLPDVFSWPALVQSHAHAQIFGFAAMFILGISYHVMPRFMGVSLRNVSCAWASYGLLLGGVILRCLYQPFAQYPAAAVTAILGSAMEVAAVIAFLAVVRATVREHKKNLPAGREGQPFIHMKYLMAGGVALLIAAIVSLSGAFLLLVRGVNVQPASLNAVWINLSIIGFIGMFVFGVGQRTMPHFLGLEHLRPAMGIAALAALLTGLILQVMSLVFPAPKILIAGSAILEFIGFLLFLSAVPLLGRLPVHRPAAPPLFSTFIRTAFAWGLAGSLGYAAASIADASGIAVPRTLVDAYRHAWTLGWVTLLIVGVGYRIIPIFFGREIAWPGGVPIIYGCLVSAAAVRVGADVLSVWFPGAYPWASLSGLLAIIGILFFANEIWSLTSKEDPSTAARTAAKPAITETANVAAVLEAYPQLLSVFVRHGFGALQNPVARKTVARFITVGQAAKKHGVDESVFLEELNHALAG